MYRKSLDVLFGVILLLEYGSCLNIEIRDPSAPDSVALPDIQEDEKMSALAIGLMKREAIVEHEKKLVADGVVLSPDQPGYLNSATKKLSSDTYNIAVSGQIVLQASIALAEANNLTMTQRRFGAVALPEPDLNDCFPPISCDSEFKYRSIDGSCNNLANSRWGQAKTPFIRNIAADYGDGLDVPRLASDGQPLPSARIVSERGTDGDDDPHRRFSHMLMQWGQFLDHDLTLTPIVTGAEHDVSCCENGVFRPEEDRHIGCLPIAIPPTDPFYGGRGIRCMEFIRSAPITSQTCTFSARQQMNINSAYIDASNVYGSDVERASDLRENVGGRLRVFSQEGRDLLPPDDAPEEDCHNKDHECFKAGDIRVNEQPDLAVMHTVWMREHNRIANELNIINPQWDDERLYQESRRIVGAQMQHITYNEWLPKILGRDFMEFNGLLPNNDSYAYNDCVDASITNEFATAAFRFGHTLIQQILERRDAAENVEKKNVTFLGNVFFDVDILYETGKLDSFIRGLAKQQCQKYDRNINPELTTKLYSGPADFGLDLIALNIQRGREHGLPSYVKFRESCGLQVPSTFSDLRGLMKNGNVKMLIDTYSSLNDIDLFIGGILEKPDKPGLIGETFKCILGNQFERLKFGDRFYYENRESRTTRFSRAQLRQIRKVRLSRILCDNGDGITNMRKDAFKSTGRRVSCTNTNVIPRMDLGKWSE